MNTEHKAKPKICCEQVSKTFIQKGNQEVPVISNVSINVHENEFLVVCGPGQCGKSTLLKIIAGLELPDTGTVTIDGKPKPISRILISFLSSFSKPFFMKTCSASCNAP